MGNKHVGFRALDLGCLDLVGYRFPFCGGADVQNQVAVGEDWVLYHHDGAAHILCVCVLLRRFLDC